MSVYSRNSERRRVMPEYCSDSKEYVEIYGSPEGGHLETEKKVRREIANSNERRRMQSINAGFQSLKTLIPHDGEKLSKAAILQHTAEFIQNLKREKDRLESENSQLQRMLTVYNNSPPRKRWKRDTGSLQESSDEGIAADYEDLVADDIKRELVSMKCQLERERKLRIELERQIIPRDIRELTTQVQIVQMQNEKMVYIDSTPAVKPDPVLVPCTDTVMKTEEERPMVVCDRELDSKQSVSSRNIATILEAISHLEGNNTNINSRNEHSIPHSEESEKESSITSDAEDIVNSDSDSPLIYRPPQHMDIKYHTEVLHSPHLEHYVYRPGVIVQKS